MRRGMIEQAMKGFLDKKERLCTKKHLTVFLRWYKVECAIVSWVTDPTYSSAPHVNTANILFSLFHSIFELFLSLQSTDLF